MSEESRTGDDRSTAAPLPPGGGAAAVVFGDRLDLAVRYAHHLATSGVERGLVGPREVPRLWERHILNCAAVAGLLEPGARVADVGSGAGLPGLVLAIVRPDVEVTLVEPLLRRVTWLEEVVDDLGLSNVTVVRTRAEELHRAGPTFEVVTARAVAALDRLAGWCLPLVEPGGRLLALKGAAAADEVEDARPVLARLGAVDVSIVECPVTGLDEATTVVVVTTTASESARPSGRGVSQGARGGRSTPGRSRTRSWRRGGPGGPGGAGGDRSSPRFP